MIRRYLIHVITFHNKKLAVACVLSLVPRDIKPSLAYTEVQNCNCVQLSGTACVVATDMTRFLRLLSVWELLDRNLTTL